MIIHGFAYPVVCSCPFNYRPTLNSSQHLSSTFFSHTQYWSNLQSCAVSSHFLPTITESWLAIKNCSISLTFSCAPKSPGLAFTSQAISNKHHDLVVVHTAVEMLGLVSEWNLCSLMWVSQAVSFHTSCDNISSSCVFCFLFWHNGLIVWARINLKTFNHERL